MSTQPDASLRSQPLASAPGVSTWAPFRDRAFAVIWLATIVSNIGSWMYNVASGWLMISLCQTRKNCPVSSGEIFRAIPTTISSISSPVVVRFCTPIAAMGQVIIETWLLLAAQKLSAGAAMSARVGISLIMLGPGAWSIDSRLFGRRRIDLP